MIDTEIKVDDKLIVVRGDFKGLKLFVRDTYVNNKGVKQIVLARQDDCNDFCRESEDVVKHLCDREVQDELHTPS